MDYNTAISTSTAFAKDLAQVGVDGFFQVVKALLPYSVLILIAVTGIWLIYRFISSARGR